MSFECSERVARRVALAAAMLGLGLLGSCGLTMTVPSGFLELEAGGGDVIKATTPDDARLWVREWQDDDGGELAFWAEALGTDLERRGYRRRENAAADRAARDGAGTAGVVQEFETRASGEAYGYLVAVFVEPAGWFGSATIRTVEFAAVRERYDALRDGVIESLATLR